jgi:23S rRNA maturation-related 3'-5' exoribonuclease YhaM
VIVDHHYAGLRRPITDTTRQWVVEDFPEIGLIADETMRTRAVEAWSYALCCSDFQRIVDIPPEGHPGAPVLRKGTEADHVRGVVRLAKVTAAEFEQSYPGVAIDWDVLMAGAVCHDVGLTSSIQAIVRGGRRGRRIAGHRRSGTRFSACMCA